MVIMTHVVVGFPSLRVTERLVVALVAGGSQIIELQVPFSDPVADGPTISAANEVAQRNGVTLKEVLAFTQRITKKFPETTFYLMSYYNPIFRFGLGKFARVLKRVGARGVIIPDLPLEEAGPLLGELRRHEREMIFVVAPNTLTERLRKIAMQARGLIYCVARLGVTGKATSFDTELKKFLVRVKKFTTLPLAIGFGVASARDVSAIKKAGGEIAVVGSALIQTYKKGDTQAIKRFIKILTLQ